MPSMTYFRHLRILSCILVMITYKSHFDILLHD